MTNFEIRRLMSDSGPGVTACELDGDVRAVRKQNVTKYGGIVVQILTWSTLCKSLPKLLRKNQAPPI